MPSHGRLLELAVRANVEDQRVLYPADQEKTAIAEVRPPLGYYVCRFGRTAVPRYNVKLPRDLATPRLSLLVQDVAQTGRDRMEIQ